jgi:outer membrane protein W
MSPALRTSIAALAAAWAVSAAAQRETGEAAPEPSGGGWLAGFHFRLGALGIIPTGRGGEVQLSDVNGTARLSGLHDGPVSGSSTALGTALMPAAIVGWAPPILDRQLSVETILALPFKQRMYAGGTLANTPLAATALGLPTGVPALGRELGEVTLLPPVVTAVYRFFPQARIRPYLGAGGILLLVLDARITNPVLTSVREPRVEIPPALGWVAQAGAEVRFELLGRTFFLSADAKYVGNLNVTAKVKDVWVALPNLPVYGAARVGDTTAHMKIDPLIAFVGVGMDL